MLRIIFIVLTVFCSFSINAQVIDDFSDGDISNNPMWLGDVSHFIINPAGELQLKAPAAGESRLYVETVWPDSFELKFELRMVFAPSASNYGKVYLMIDDADFLVANGYYLQFGENGSDDAVKFYRLDTGNSVLLGTASIGSIANDPVNCKVKINYSNGGNWTMSFAYNQSNIYTDQVSMVDNTHLPDNGKYFMLDYIYTSTRTDKFYFDNLLLKESLPDKDGPQLLSVDILTDRSLLLSFNEQLDANSAEDINHFNIDQGVGNPILAALDAVNFSQITLDFAKPFPNNVVSNITVNEVKDIYLNPMQSPAIFPIVYLAPPNKGDLLISEILFNPYLNGQDFLELYNISDRKLLLKGMVITNFDRSESKIITDDIQLDPKSYVAFSEDIPHLIATYLPPAESRIIFQDIPSFNNDKGNVSISFNNMVLDSFDYNENMHLPLLDDVEGVSLERIDFLSPTNVASNWYSAASTVNYATPGYKNSSGIIPIISEEEFVLLNKTFTPNGDGDRDFMVMQYGLQENGYVANITIYDSEGFPVRKIADNELLGSNGIITWDGLNEAGKKERLGIYIISGELFNDKLQTKSFQKVCVLADILD